MVHLKFFSSKSICGGFVQYADGKFVKYFNNGVDSCFTVWVEFWMLRLGIKLTQQLNLSLIIFELYSKVVVNMIQSRSSSKVQIQPLF